MTSAQPGPLRAANPPADTASPVEVVPTGRIVVTASGGGEGATTVAALMWTLLHAADGRPRATWSRADDPIAGRLLVPPAPVGVGECTLAIIDGGPHGTDAARHAADRLVLVCAATTDSIERARALLAAADERGVHVRALVVCGRTEQEQRWGRVRVEQAARFDPRVVPLPFDPALSIRGSIDVGSLDSSTLAAGRRVLELIGPA